MEKNYSKLEMFDTHCHLNDERFNGVPIIQIVEEAKLNGVKYINNIGTNKEDCYQVVKTAAEFENVYASIGIIPQEADSIKSIEELGFIRDLFFDKKYHRKITSIGEIGLDYFHRKDNAGWQKEIFIKQIEISKELNLPLNIHCRDAYDDVYEILKSKNCNKGIMHCFTADYETAKKFISLGFYISIPGVVTFDNAKALQEAVKKIGIEHIVIETDAGWLAPVPYRGKINFPKYIGHTAEKIAELKEMKIEDVVKITTKNALKVYSNVE